MSNNVNEEFELTPSQRVAGNVIAGAGTLLCGLFLLLVGFGVFSPLTVEEVWLCAILFAVGLVFVVTALVQKNSVTMWLSFAFIVPGVVNCLCTFTHLTYAQLYPLYIAIPAIASFFTMFLTGSYSAHGKTILFFGVLAGIFALNSSALLGWNIVVPIIVVFVGILIMLVALKAKKGDNDNE
ncbi:MAG: hypothetical protein IKM16_01040 [Clostridia bacterium]|nr:hypothetical protein [Clostridia bacterium]MBR7141136.1 hypothetical protein [Clostridia bacterium]